MYKLATKPLWSKGRLGFCGIKLKTFDILDKKRFRKDAELQAFIALVGKSALGKLGELC